MFTVNVEGSLFILTAVTIGEFPICLWEGGGGCVTWSGKAFLRVLYADRGGGGPSTEQVVFGG